MVKDGYKDDVETGEVYWMERVNHSNHVGLVTWKMRIKEDSPMNMGHRKIEELGNPDGKYFKINFNFVNFFARSG